MPAMKELSRAQSRFLRSFNKSPAAGPPEGAWPAPLVFQRWLAQPPFRAAYRALRAAIKAQLELRSLCAALAAHDQLDPRPAANPSTPSTSTPTLADTSADTPADSPAPSDASSYAPAPPPPSPAPASAPPSPTAHPNPEPRTLTPQQRIELEREKLAHRANLLFLRLAHARLIPPPRRAPIPPPPPPDPDDEDLTGLTPEEIAIRLAHPNCRPEVAIAAFKGEPHPFYDQPEYDMTTNPPTFIRPPSPIAVARAKASHDEAVALIKAEYARRGETPPPELLAPYTPRDPYAQNANAPNLDADPAHL